MDTKKSKSNQAMVSRSQSKRNVNEEEGPTAEDAAIANLVKESERQAQRSNYLVDRLNRLNDIRVSGGPFHYQMRAGTYGDIYDETPWKYNLEMEQVKDRGVDKHAMKGRYERRVLVQNWVEERRDRQHIKYDNSPKLSQYGYVYKSEYNYAYSKPLCNKARDVLLKIRSFPMTAHPGHQPDIEVDVLKFSAPTPENCIIDKEVAECRKEMETQKRYRRQARELSGEL